MSEKIPAVTIQSSTPPELGSNQPLPANDPVLEWMNLAAVLEALATDLPTVDAIEEEMPRNPGRRSAAAKASDVRRRQIQGLIDEISKTRRLIEDIIVQAREREIDNKARLRDRDAVAQNLRSRAAEQRERAYREEGSAAKARQLNHLRDRLLSAIMCYTGAEITHSQHGVDGNGLPHITWEDALGFRYTLAADYYLEVTHHDVDDALRVCVRNFTTVEWHAIRGWMSLVVHLSQIRGVQPSAFAKVAKRALPGSPEEAKAAYRKEFESLLGFKIEEGQFEQLYSRVCNLGNRFLDNQLGFGIPKFKPRGAASTLSDLFPDKRFNPFGPHDAEQQRFDPHRNRNI